MSDERPKMQTKVVSIELLISLGVTLAMIAVSWGSMSTKIDGISETIHEHIADNSRHQPVRERQEETRSEISVRLAPLTERIDKMEAQIQRVADRQDVIISNQQLILNALGSKAQARVNK